jgi:vacuolar-type H+-ATPase subunit E/Vma4
LNVNDKLTFFAKVVTAEALNRREGILRVIDKRIDEEVGAIRAAAEKAAESRLKLESTKIEQAKNRDIIAASREEKRKATALRAELLERLFKRVTQQLLEYVQTEEYRDNIIKEVKSHRNDRGNGHCHAQMLLTPRDVNEIFGGEDNFIRSSTKDFIGGFKLHNIETNSLEDHSFLTRLNNARDNFNALQLGTLKFNDKEGVV